MSTSRLRAGAAIALVCLAVAFAFGSRDTPATESHDMSSGQGGMTISGSGAMVELPDGTIRPKSSAPSSAPPK